MRSLRPESAAFTLLLGALVTLASFATDMALPVLAATAASFGVTSARAAYTLSVFIFGFALGPLLFGAMSDRLGRRPVLLAGCAAFACFGAVAVFTRSLDALLLCRLLMGVGAGTVHVVVVAIVRDVYAGAEARVRQSYVNLAAGLAPLIAPTLGILVAAVGGWRLIYGVLAAGGIALLGTVALRLDEHVPHRTAPASDSLARRYARVLRHPVSVGYVLVGALNFGALFAYISGSSLVLIDVLRVSRRTYGALFACTTLGLVIGALVSARLTRRGVASKRLVVVGLAAIVSSAVAILTATVAGVLSVGLLVPLAAVGTVGLGIARPHTAQGALEPLPEIAGAASAVLSCAQMLTAALASTVVAALFTTHSSLAMAAPMAACALAAVAVYVAVVRRAERAATRSGGWSADRRRDGRVGLASDGTRSAENWRTHSRSSRRRRSPSTSWRSVGFRCTTRTRRARRRPNGPNSVHASPWRTPCCS
jgi:DHA1 family bicyclomycin/chloramphenicol resistance-like MFS transporter